MARTITPQVKTVKISEIRKSNTGNIISNLSRNMTYTSKSWTRSNVTEVKRNAKGWREPTPYTSDATDVEWTHCQSYYVNKIESNNWTHDGYYPPVGMPAMGGSVGSLRSELIQRALLNIKDQKINLAVTLAEAAKTINLVANSAQTLYTAAHNLRKGNIRIALQTLGLSTALESKIAKTRGFGNKWLAMKYGWLPITYDVYGAVSELQRQTNEEGWKIVGRATKKIDSFSSTTATQYHWILTFRNTYGHTLSKTQKVALWYELDAPGFRRFSQVGFTNPLILVEELIPWSFVFDWFLTIGDALNSLDADFGLNYLGGSHTYFEKSTITAFTSSAVNRTDDKVAWQTSTMPRYDRVKSSRDIITSPSGFSLHLKNPLSVSHAISACALLLTFTNR